MLVPARKVPSPFPKKIGNTLTELLTTARQRVPSPSKSATATEVGWVVLTFAADWKAPSPFPKNSEILPTLKEDGGWGTTRSRNPSPLKSPTASIAGLPLVAKL